MLDKPAARFASMKDAAIAIAAIAIVLAIAHLLVVFVVRAETADIRAGVAANAEALRSLETQNAAILAEIRAYRADNEATRLAAARAEAKAGTVERLFAGRYPPPVREQRWHSD